MLTNPDMLLPYGVLLATAFVGAAIVLRAGITVAARVYLLVGLGFFIAAGAVYVSDVAIGDAQSAYLRVWLHEMLILLGAPMLLCGFAHMGQSAVVNRSMQRAMQHVNALRSELQSEKGMLASVLQSSPGALLVLDAQRDNSGTVVDMVIRLANEAAQELFGKPRSTLRGSMILAVAPCLRDTEVFTTAVGVLEQGLPSCTQFRHERRTGNTWYSLVIVKHADGLAVNVTDVTQSKEVEEALRRAAHTDTLTGLANRAALRDRIQHAVSLSRRIEDYHFALLFLDFDRFKLVNDTLGHDVGDQLLVSISERLRANLRAIDLPARGGHQHMPARLGGDEFVIVIEGLADPRHASIVAERLQDDLSRPHRIDGHEITSTASIGVVTSSGEYDSADAMLRDADTAMYEAKKSGRARHAFFETSMHERLLTQASIERDLRIAAESGMFLLEFQPIVDLSRGEISAFEALIRWPHPTRGVMYPTDFIELAENSRLVIPMGRWVIERAGEMLHRINAMPGVPSVSIHVNHSKLEILEPDFPAFIRERVEAFGFDPALLHLEVTESICLDNLDAILPVLHELKHIGLTIVLDDFGTGDATMGLLHRFPFDAVKIDRRFLSSDQTTYQNAAFLESMIGLCHNLKIPVVAEGVENAEHLALLQALGCDGGQGWLFGRSLPADEAVERLRVGSPIARAA